MVERTAQCHCGSLRLTASGDPERVYVCHCRACQRRTGSPIHFGCTYLRTRVQIDGESKVYERAADSGSILRFHFCPNCGSNIFWETNRSPDTYGITAGSFADSNFPAPTFALWEEAIYPWLGVANLTDHFPQGLGGRIPK